MALSLAPRQANYPCAHDVVGRQRPELAISTETITLLMSLSFAGAAVFVAVTRRHKPTWKAGVALLLACAELTLARGLRGLTPDLASKVFYYRFIMLGFTIAPTAFLWLALHYAGIDRWLTWRRLAVLSLFPVLTIGCIWTNEHHGWVWDPQSTATIVVQEQFLTRETAGVWYWCFLAYSYAVLLLAAALLVRLLARSRGVYGWQARGLLAAAALTIGAASADLFHFSPFRSFVATGFGLSAGILTAVLTLGVLRRKDLLAATRSAVLDRIADAIIVLDSADLVAEVNAAAFEFFPNMGPTALGRPLSGFVPELSSLPVDDQDREVLIHSGGADRVFNLRGAHMLDGQSRVAGRVVVLQDITERKRSDEAIRRLNSDLEHRVLERTQKLEIANRELEAFAYSVSHDLRAPLRLIDGHTRILVDDHRELFDADALHTCEVIERETCRMGHLIDALLALSRFSRAELKTERIDMASMAADSFEAMTTAEERRRIDFSVEVLPAAIGDPVIVRQIWINLLSNAIKFSSQRERAVIKVGAVDGATETVYSVNDNGIGFDDKYAGRLFGVFQRLQADPRFPGTGVGLAIVHRAVQRHDGRVWAHATTDKGAHFYFALPKRA